MKYLYGDATESPLDINYLDLLHDVLDFGTSVMLAHGSTTQQRKKAKNLQAAAKVERDQLESVNNYVIKALATAKSRVTTDNTKGCVDAIGAVAGAEIKRAESGIQARLAKELDQINRSISREQANNVKRLEALLLKHDLPECALWVNTRFHAQSNSYVAELIGKAACDVAFVIDLEVPTEHLLSEPVRVDRLAPGLTIQVPEKSGWVRKSIKMRTHKLSKEYVVAVSHATKRSTIKLRNALHDADSGYDLIFGTKNRVAVSRIAKGTESEPFEPDIEDKKALLSFYDELNRSLNELKTCRRALRGAQLDATPLAEHADATVLVRRLVEQMAPVIQEISKHSLSPHELVLKRVLADNRREEVFQSKAGLRAKLDPLAPELRKVFAPFGLDIIAPDLTGPPPPIRGSNTQVMVNPQSVAPAAAVPVAQAQAPAMPQKNAVSGQSTMPEQNLRRAPVPSAPSDDSPVVTVQGQATAGRNVDNRLPRVDEVSAADEALPLPLMSTPLVPDPARNPRVVNKTRPLESSAPARGGVSMPANTRRSRGHRSVPPAPPSSGSALPKPSAPPKRPAIKIKEAPKVGFQSHDSVDVQLDELLKSK